MNLLSVRDLSVTLGGRRVVERVSLDIAAGQCVGLIGPNGAGKSSMMRAALGLIPASGESSLAPLSPARRARAAAWLPQSREIAWDLPAEALVALGRAPWRRPGAPLSPADRAAMARAMARTDIAGFAARPVTALSGGEQARVLLARALAQEAPLLLADEPVAALDPAHQIATMEVFAALAAEGGAVVAALHDLGLAARWCNRLILLDRGRVVADGSPETVLTAPLLRRIYGIEAHFGAAGGRMIVAPLARSPSPATAPAAKNHV